MPLVYAPINVFTLISALLKIFRTRRIVRISFKLLLYFCTLLKLSCTFMYQDFVVNLIVNLLFSFLCRWNEIVCKGVIFSSFAIEHLTNYYTLTFYEWWTLTCGPLTFMGWIPIRRGMLYVLGKQKKGEFIARTRQNGKQH